MRIQAAVLATLLTAAAARADDLPAQLRLVKIQQRMGAQVPLELEFRDEAERPVRLGDCAAGKPVVLVLAQFRCPRLCSLVLSGVSDSLGKVPFAPGKDYEVVVVSFDPREKPELAAAVKESFAERLGRPGAAAGCHFLTGEGRSAKRLADAVGFRYFYEADRDEYRHSAGIVMLTPSGKVARYFFGIEFAPRDLRLGLGEASEGRIGSAVDNALLLGCLSYDPETGKYSVAAMKLMRLGGALTVLVLVVWVGWNWLRSRRTSVGHVSNVPGGQGTLETCPTETPAVGHVSNVPGGQGTLETCPTNKPCE